MEHLLEAICRGGTECTTHCEWCGRTHFRDAPAYHGDYDEGELEELRKNNEEKPDEYIIHYEGDAIGYGDFCGKQIVWRCPCNEEHLKPYVDHYWSHARILAEFLKSRAKEEANTARVRATVLDAIGENAQDAGINIAYKNTIPTGKKWSDQDADPLSDIETAKRFKK